MKTKVQNLRVNRTGVALVPERAQELIASVLQGGPSSQGDEQLIASARGAYVKEAEEIGHIPPATNAKGVAQTTTEAGLAMFLDKLGERLAFERSGTRLYEALLSKYDAVSSAGPIQRAEIEHIHAEEHEHFTLIKRAIEGLGGDPTAVTPSADIAAVSAMGLPQVLTDPRTTFAQCLQAILVAELVDNDGWGLLIALADKLGQTQLGESFRAAFLTEQEHLERVRTWLLAFMDQPGIAAE